MFKLYHNYSTFSNKTPTRNMKKWLFQVVCACHPWWRSLFYRVFKSKRYKLNCYCAGYLDPTELRLVTFFYWQSDICEYIFDTEQHWVWISLFSRIAEIKKTKNLLKIHWNLFLKSLALAQSRKSKSKCEDLGQSISLNLVYPQTHHPHHTNF